ncbi:MAG: hypothetical protein QNI99_02760 [Woeseiaceae bacterium]|nr:hypothetical protein [Woeseiaceae bacterium]
MFTFALLTATIGLSACASGASADAQGETLLITPIALYVPNEPSDSGLPRRQSLPEFLETHFDGEPRFNEEFRPVPENGTPIPVDCTSVSGLVVVVHVDGTGRSRTLLDSVRLRYQWIHPELELQAKEYNHVRGAMNVPFPRYYELDDTKYAYGFLRLDRSDEKTDGVYTVIVSHLGQEEFRAQFRLENCPDSSEDDARAQTAAD